MATRSIPVILILFIILSGCSLSRHPEPEIRYITRTVTVDVPIPYVPDVPPELRVRYIPQVPSFVPPSHSDARVALTLDDSAKLQSLILGLKSRLDAWELWHSTLLNNNNNN